MDFSSLVIMEKDATTGFLTKEIGSYEVSEGAEYVTKLYKEKQEVVIYFDTHKDVEEWEFSAIYDLFPYDVFDKESIEIEDKDEEYNPTWCLKIAYDEEHSEMKEKLHHICNLIKSAIETVLKEIKDKEEEYK